jgi:hypothetical protein
MPLVVGIVFSRVKLVISKELSPFSNVRHVTSKTLNTKSYNNDALLKFKYP